MGQQIALALRESMHRVLVKLVSFLPGLLALLVAVVVLTAIGALLALVLRRILMAARFDERFARTQNATVADWSPGHSPTMLVARTAFWACVILGFIIGISAFDASYSGNSQIAAILIPYLTHSVGAVLILIAGIVIARFLSLGIKWLVLVLTAAMVLDHLEIGGAIVDLAFGILFGGIVLTLSLAIGLGSRDLVSRSLEKNADKSPDREDFEDIAPTPPPTRPSETLRHF